MKTPDPHLGLLFIVIMLIVMTHALDFIYTYEKLRIEMPQYLTLNSEARLAFGKRVDFKQVDHYDLELIPGIAATTSDKIMISRDVILRAARKVESADKHNALQVVHGIGPKSALQFGDSICLEELPCF